MGQRGVRRNTGELGDLIANAANMRAARFILEVQSRGHDPVAVLDVLPLQLDALGHF